MPDVKTCKVLVEHTGDTAIVVVPDGWTRRRVRGVEFLHDEHGQAVDVEVYKGAVWALRDGKRERELEVTT